MNKTIEKILLLLFQLAGFSVLLSLFFVWQGNLSPKIINYFFVIAGLYLALWLFTTIFAWKWLLNEQRFLALLSACGTALTGGFIYILVSVMFEYYK